MELVKVSLAALVSGFLCSELWQEIFKNKALLTRGENLLFSMLSVSVFVGVYASYILSVSTRQKVVRNDVPRGHLQDAEPVFSQVKIKIKENLNV